MIALKINDVKSFMSSLLLQSVFDNFLLSEFEIQTTQKFQMWGKRNKEWFTDEEWEACPNQEYLSWGETKPIAYHLIKGNKTPLSFKIIFLLSSSNTDKLIAKGGNEFQKENIDGLCLNIRFDKGELQLITGTSLKIFTLDKSLEQSWDANMKLFLNHAGIDFVEL